jgi:hypothetical protein
MKPRAFLAILLAAVLLPACQGRQLLSVKDGPSGGDRTTILKTLDTTNYILFGTAKIVFWECGERSDGLSCRKTCDVKDDDGDMLKCETIFPYRNL